MANLRILSSQRSPVIPCYFDTKDRLHSSAKPSFKLDLNQLCGAHLAQTFCIYVKNPHLSAWHVKTGDLLIVNRELTPRKDDWIVLDYNGEYHFFQFLGERDGKKMLFALDITQANFTVNDWREIPFAGVVTNMVQQVRERRCA